MQAKSYTWEFLRHPYNQWAGVGFLASGVLASFPYGMDAFMLTLLGFLAVEVVGSVFVPSLPAFRRWVDSRASQAATQAERDALLAEIKSHGGSNYVASYEAMCRRVASLYRVASDNATSLTEADVQQLERLTLDYLRLCLSDAVLGGEQGASNTKDIERRLKAVNERLAQGGLDREEEQQLLRARGEYDEVQKGQRRMASRRSAMEASLIAMPARMDEVYQMVMASPAAGDLSQQLSESVKRLRIAEEVSMDVETILGIDGARSQGAVVTGEEEVAARRRQAAAGRQ